MLLLCTIQYMKMTMTHDDITLPDLSPTAKGVTDWYQSCWL